MYTILKDTPLEMTLEHPLQTISNALREIDQPINLTLHVNPTAIWSERAKDAQIVITSKITSNQVRLETIPRRHEPSNWVPNTLIHTLTNKHSYKFQKNIMHDIDFDKRLSVLDKNLTEAYRSRKSNPRLVKAICKLFRHLHAKPKDMEAVALFIYESYAKGTPAQKKVIHNTIRHEINTFVAHNHNWTSKTYNLTAEASIIYHWLKLKPLPVTVRETLDLDPWSDSFDFGDSNLNKALADFLLSQSCFHRFNLVSNGPLQSFVSILNHSELVTIKHEPVASETDRNAFERYLRFAWVAKFDLPLPEYLIPITEEL